MNMDKADPVRIEKWLLAASRQSEAARRAAAVSIGFALAYGRLLRELVETYGVPWERAVVAVTPTELLTCGLPSALDASRAKDILDGEVLALVRRCLPERGDAEPLIRTWASEGVRMFMGALHGDGGEETFADLVHGLQIWADLLWGARCIAEDASPEAGRAMLVATEVKFTAAGVPESFRLNPRVVEVSDGGKTIKIRAGDASR